MDYVCILLVGWLDGCKYKSKLKLKLCVGI